MDTVYLGFSLEGTIPNRTSIRTVIFGAILNFSDRGYLLILPTKLSFKK